MVALDVLDELDHALITALRADGRAPVAELARELGVTRATVTKRIARLEERGIILGFTVRLAQDADPHAIRAICHLAIEGRTPARHQWGVGSYRRAHGDRPGGH